MTTLINLTPHPVVVLDALGCVVASFPPSGTVARITEIVADGPPIDTADGRVPQATVTYSETVEGLPEPRPGTAYIVSRVLAADVARADVYFPGGEVRDDAGQIVGCRYLGQFAQRGTADA